MAQDVFGRGQSINGERIITMSRTRLIEKLKANREEHALIYEEAKAGYAKAVDKALGDLAHKAERMTADDYDYSDLVEGLNELTKPSSHLKAYDESIEMFEWDEVENVQLKFSEFRKLVLDKWDWQRGFLANNAGYSASATLKLG
jgi:hypothetical protein